MTFSVQMTINGEDRFSVYPQKIVHSRRARTTEVLRLARPYLASGTLGRIEEYSIKNWCTRQNRQNDRFLTYTYVIDCGSFEVLIQVCRDWTV